MFNLYLKKGFKTWFLSAAMLISTFAWSQTAVVSPLPVPFGDIANGTNYNTIYGFKIEVGLESNIFLQNLTVNFTGSFSSNTANVKVIYYKGTNTPLDPDNNYIDSRSYLNPPNVGGVNVTNNWGISLNSGETYYFFIESNFSNNGSISGIGSNITASIPSLSSIEFTAANPVTVSGSFTVGTSYSVVAGNPIITPLTLPGKNLSIGNYRFPILGYKIECPANILSSVKQSEIVATISGSYIASVDGVNLSFSYLNSPTYNQQQASGYSNSYNLVSNTGTEEIAFTAYQQEIFKNKPLYVFLTALSSSGIAGHTFKATLEPAKFLPSSTGAAIVGNVFTLSDPSVTITVPSTFNANTELTGLNTYAQLYTFGLSAPANSDFVFSSFNMSLSGVGNSLNSFGNGEFYLTYGSSTPMGAKTSQELENMNYAESNYYNSISPLSTSGYNYNINNTQIIPAGKTLYYTIVVRTFQQLAPNIKLQLLSVESINNKTFSGTTMQGGVVSSKPKVVFRTVNSILGSNISPYGEQLVYAFNGLGNVFYYTLFNNLVVTLTGNVDYNNIAQVRLRAIDNIDNNIIGFKNANNIATASNPTSNVIQLNNGQGGGLMFYNIPKETQYFITIELKNGVDASVVGQNIGVAKIETSAFTLVNYWYNAANISVIGTNLINGTNLVYQLSPVTVTSNALPAGNQLGINQEVTPIYSAKIEAVGGVPVSSLTVSVSGNYTSSEISRFYLYASDKSVFNINNSNSLGSIISTSTGAGESLLFDLFYTASAGTNYYYIVPQVENTTATGKTVSINAIPSANFVVTNTAIAKTVNLPAGNTYTLAAPTVTFTCTPSTGGLMPKGGHFKAYSVEVNSNVAFTLNNFALKSNGFYNRDGFRRVYAYFSNQPLSNYNDNFETISTTNKIASLIVLTSSGEVFDYGNINVPLPSGKSYITIFVDSRSRSKQSFGVAGIVTDLTTINGSTITYINNIASTPTTVLGQILTLNSIKLDNTTIYRGDNQLLYKAKYKSNVADFFEYFYITTLGNIKSEDYKNADPAQSWKVYVTTSTSFNPTASTNIAAQANGASDIEYRSDYFEFYNYGLRLEANTEYYIYVAVDIAPTATLGNTVRVYGEDEGNIEDDFQFYPDGNYSFDRITSKMENGNEMMIIDVGTPSITFSGGTLTVGGSSLDVSTLFSTNSDGVVSYTIEGSAATLTGSMLSPVAVGSVTVTGTVAATFTVGNGFYAGAKTAVFEVVAAPITSILTSEIHSFVIYPNPVKDGVLYFSTPISGSIINILGVEISKFSNASSVDVASLARGIYLLKSKSNVLKTFIIE